MLSMESTGWAGIQALKARLAGRILRFAKHKASSSFQNDSAFFEADLSYIFTTTTTVYGLSEKDDYELNEKSHCLLSSLNEIINRDLLERLQAQGQAELTTGKQAAVAKRPQDDAFDFEQFQYKYPALWVLFGVLDTTRFKFNLANGSEFSLFRLPNGDVGLRARTRLSDWKKAFHRVGSFSGCSTATYTSQTEIELDLVTPDEEPGDEIRAGKSISVAVGSIFEEFQRFGCGMAHEIKLRVSEELPKASSQSVLEMFLSHCQSTTGWQEAKRVSFEFPITKEQKASICTAIQRSWEQRKRLHFCIEETRLIDVTEELPPVAINPDGHNEEPLDLLFERKAFRQINLTSFLDRTATKTFSRRDKTTLALALARYLMDFFDEDLGLAPISLTPDKIFLVRSSENLSANHLWYIQLKPTLIGPGAPNLVNALELGSPILFSFAKLLIEIESGERVPLDVHQESKDNLPNLGPFCAFVEQALSGGGSPYYFEAVQKCLLLPIHLRAFKDLDKARSATLAVKEVIYKEIVKNLERELNPEVNKRKRRDSISSQPPTKKTLMAHSTEREIIQPITGLHQSRYNRVLETENGNSRKSLAFFEDNTPGTGFVETLCQYADGFMNEHKIAYQSVILDTSMDDSPMHIPLVHCKNEQKYPDNGSRVRVAILDTGLDMNHPHMDAWTDRIKDIRSWVNGDDGKKRRSAGDQSGHGTFVTSLLLETAPDCDVYIARIAAIDPIGPREIAKAIVHATTKWEVDIIIMSFGFPDETIDGCREFRRAINHAHADNILMFAAASNNGAHQTPTFPARLSEVFCIYAADGLGNRSAANPTALPREYNFSTLGVAVESSWPCSSVGSEARWTCRKSGSSFATPIAAGVAAFILVYVQQNMTSEQAERFKDKDKMRDMLFSMSMSRDGYNVISIAEFCHMNPNQRLVMIQRILAGRPFRI